MALNPIDKIRALATAMYRVGGVRNAAAMAQADLSNQFPTAATQVQALLAPIDTACVNALTTLQNAINATTVVAADQTAYAAQAEADARAGKV